MGEVQIGLGSGLKQRALSPRQLLLLPDLLWAFVFFLAPFGLVVLYAFATFDVILYEFEFGWTLSNFGNILDPLYLSAFTQSLLLSFMTVAGCFAVGYPLAYFISLQSPRWQRVLLALVIVPFWSSFIVRTYALANILENGGPLDDVARGLGLIGDHLDVLYSQTAIALGLVYSYLPTMVLPIYVALERIEPMLLHAANDLGADARRAFWRVTFPLSLPGVAAGCIITGVPALGEYVVPEILGGGKSLMIGNVITDQYLTVGNIPFGSAIAVLLMLVLSIVVLLGRNVRPIEIA